MVINLHEMVFSESAEYVTIKFTEMCVLVKEFYTAQIVFLANRQNVRVEGEKTSEFHKTRLGIIQDFRIRVDVIPLSIVLAIAQRAWLTVKPTRNFGQCM